MEHFNFQEFSLYFLADKTSWTVDTQQFREPFVCFSFFCLNSQCQKKKCGNDKKKMEFDSIIHY